MVVNFSESWEVERRAQEAAIRCSAINPAKAMDHSSISAAAAASSEDTATPSITPRAPAGRSTQVAKQTDRFKGKEPAHAASKTKRTREGGELEPAREKTSQGPCSIDFAGSLLD